MIKVRISTIKIFSALIITSTVFVALFLIIAKNQNAYSENERSSWPVFENRDFGYSLRYPQGWFYHTGGFLPPNTVIFSQSATFNPDKETELMDPHISLVVKDLRQERLTEDLGQYISREASELKRGNTSDEKIGEHNIRRLRRQAAGTEGEVEMFYLKRGQRLIRVGVFPAEEEYINIAKEMIKTLRFNSNGQNP